MGRQLELHRPSRLPLADGRVIDRVTAGRYVLDLESQHVAATQLGGERRWVSGRTCVNQRLN